MNSVSNFLCLSNAEMKLRPIVLRLSYIESLSQLNFRYWMSAKWKLDFIISPVIWWNLLVNFNLVFIAFYWNDWDVSCVNTKLECQSRDFWRINIITDYHSRDTGSVNMLAYLLSRDVRRVNTKTYWVDWQLSSINTRTNCHYGCLYCINILPYWESWDCVSINYLLRVEEIYFLIAFVILQWGEMNSPFVFIVS